MNDRHKMYIQKGTFIFFFPFFYPFSWKNKNSAHDLVKKNIHKKITLKQVFFY